METTITDEAMRQLMTTAKNYCVMLLRAGPKWEQPGRGKIIWEHGRRNLQLRADGVLSIVCPVLDGGDMKGICIFNTSVEETRRIYDKDPGVMAGVFVYEAHLCRSFPGDSLPK
jgi:hypothetical protein